MTLPGSPVATYAGGIVGFVVNYILTLIMAFNSGEDKRTGKKFSAFLIILAVSIVGWVMKEWADESGRQHTAFSATNGL